MSLTKRMGDGHEKWLLRLLGGKGSRGSGNQWHNPADGRHDRTQQEFAFAWDGKSTLGKGVSVTRDMWEKITEQADGELPMIAIRFYRDEGLRDDEAVDLICVEAHVFASILERALAQE